ncbi:MAG: hypothetical protein GY714_30940 [Desulfobacterales bacterium]|nr:hypothetical protein [Desulfobacterales bacterium]
MLNRIKLIMLFVLIIFTTTTFGKSLFLVAPGVLHLNLKNKRSIESFIVRNTGDEKIRLRLTPIYFPINSKSMKMGEPLNKEVVDDISKNLIISPKIVSLKPGQRRTVRVAFRKTRKLEAGDYRAHVLIKSVNPVKQKFKPSTETKGVSLNLNIKLQTAIAVYVHSGKSNASLDFVSSKDKKGNIVITSINNTKFKYDGWFQIVQGTNKSKVERFMVFRESKRNFYINDNNQKSLTVKWGYKNDSLDFEKNFKFK